MNHMIVLLPWSFCSFQSSSRMPTAITFVYEPSPRPPDDDDDGRYWEASTVGFYLLTTPLAWWVCCFIVYIYYLYLSNSRRLRVDSYQLPPAIVTTTISSHQATCIFFPFFIVFSLLTNYFFKYVFAAKDKPPCDRSSCSISVRVLVPSGFGRWT